MRLYDYTSMDKPCGVFMTTVTQTKETRQIGIYQVIPDDTVFNLIIHALTPTVATAECTWVSDNTTQSRFLKIPMKTIIQWIEKGINFEQFTYGQNLPYTFMVYKNEWLPIELFQDEYHQIQQAKHTIPQHQIKPLPPSKLSPLSLYKTIDGRIHLFIGYVHVGNNPKKQLILIEDMNAPMTMSDIETHCTEQNENSHIRIIDSSEHTLYHHHIDLHTWQKVSGTRRELEQLLKRCNQHRIRHHTLPNNLTHVHNPYFNESYESSYHRIKNYQTDNQIPSQNTKELETYLRKIAQLDLRKSISIHNTDCLQHPISLYYQYIENWIRTTNNLWWLTTDAHTRTLLRTCEQTREIIDAGNQFIAQLET